MDFLPEFPLPTPRENDAIHDYFNKEQQFMAAENFYENPRNRQIRRIAIHAIGTGSWGRNFDPFIPYLALNYFDRFVSRYSVSDIEGDERENIFAIAFSCLTISFKMRRKSFDAIAFMKRRRVETTMLKLLVTELQILNGLEWQMRSITPFCFLDYYYPVFRKLGGFRRNSIYEIIVQSQAVHRFTRFKPSDIAFSSLMAAASILYPNQYQNILNEESAHISEKTSECLNLMIEFCNIMDCKVEPAESEADAGQRTPAAEPTRTEIPIETEEARNKGKGIMQTSSEIPTETAEARNKGKGRLQSLNESSSVRTGSQSSGTSQETVMDMSEGVRTTLASGKHITLAPDEGTTSSAGELKSKLMKFKLRWKEIVGEDLTLDPPPLVEVEANGSADETDNASALHCGCNIM